MDELGSESVPKFSRSDIKSRVSDTILERMEAILIQEAKSPVTLGVCMVDLFHSSAHWTLANSASSFFKPNR